MAAESAAHTASAHAQPARGNPLRPALAGVALSLPFAAALYYFPLEAADLLTLVLALTGGIYWGSALAAGRKTEVRIEAVAGLAVMIMALLGLWWSTTWIAAGFVAHGVWDVLHHPRAVRTPVRRWFPPFCATFDWLVAIYILYFLVL